MTILLYIVAVMAIILGFYVARGQHESECPPCAIGTGFFWIGLGVFFIFSAANYDESVLNTQKEPQETIELQSTQKE